MERSQKIIKHRIINGFTLVEMMVSIAIVATISSIFLANYHANAIRNQLILAAQKLSSDVRLMESNGLGLSSFNGSIPDGGWGVYLSTASSSNYILFADVNGNHLFDPATETYKVVYFPTGITLANISGLSGDSNVTFSPPDPEVYISYPTHSTPAKNVNTFFTLRDSALSTKVISVNFFGLVSVN